MPSNRLEHDRAGGNVKRRWIYEAAIALCAAAAAGCATPGGLPGSGALGSAVRQPAAPAAAAAGLKLAGRYSGSIKWTEGSKSYSGTLKTTIKVKGKDVSGPFDITVDGKTDDLSISGKITSEAKKSAHLSFDLDDPKGRYATGTATITGKKLTGKASVPASGSKPSVSITFKATKSKKHKK
jgi:hypothetical protein